MLQFVVGVPGLCEVLVKPHALDGRHVGQLPRVVERFHDKQRRLRVHKRVLRQQALPAFACTPSINEMGVKRRYAGFETRAGLKVSARAGLKVSARAGLKVRAEHISNHD